MKLRAVRTGAVKVAARLKVAAAGSFRRLLLLGLLSAWSLTAMLVRPPGATAEQPAPAATAAAASAAPVAPDTGRVPALVPPLAGPVVRGFDLPAGPFGPGHRGVDIAAPLGAPVLAPASGQVLFAGPVAGIAWTSIQVAPGVVVTLGPLRDLTVAAGQRVRWGTRVGRLASGHASALHLGVRVDGVPVDPLPRLASFARPRLAPLRDPAGFP
jgi:murein DD-endopeptidase MepM/ murein hydrolase activator NlpD